MIFDIFEKNNKFYIIFKALTDKGNVIYSSDLHKIFYSYFEDLIEALFVQGYDFIVGEDFGIYAETKEEAQKIVDWLESLKLMLQMGGTMNLV